MSGNLCRCGAYPGHRARNPARRRGAARLMAKLQKTTVEMEGRFEERWVLVEEEPAGLGGRSRAHRRRHARLAPDRAAARLGCRPLRLGRRAARHAAGRRSCARRTRMRRSSSTSRRRAPCRACTRCSRPADEDVKQGRSPIFQSEPAYAGAPVAALACEDAAAARAAHRGAGAALHGARLRRRSRPGAGRAAAAGGSRRGRDAATSRPAWPRPTSIVEGEYAHVCAGAARARAALRASRSGCGDELHAYVSTQGICDARAELARAFELDPDRVHVTCEFMGGGFGAKQGATTEGMIAAYLSRAARRPGRARLQRPPQPRPSRPAIARRRTSRAIASAPAATGR